MKLKIQTLCVLLFASGLLHAQTDSSGISLQSGKGILDQQPSISGLSDFLPADKAFIFNPVVKAGGVLSLNWEIQDGYYLYQKSISIKGPQGNAIPVISMPAGEEYMDEFFGRVIIYRNQLKIPSIEVNIPENAKKESNHSLTVTYQGCASAGYCYPMQRKRVDFSF